METLTRNQPLHILLHLQCSKIPAYFEETSFYIFKPAAAESSECSCAAQLPALTPRQSQHSWKAAGITRAHHFQRSLFHWAEQVLIRSRQRMKPSLLCPLQTLAAAVICGPARTSALMAPSSSLSPWIMPEAQPLCAAGDLQAHTTAGARLVLRPREILHDIYPEILRGNTRQRSVRL